jgi:hypothetical protein
MQGYQECQGIHEQNRKEGQKMGNLPSTDIIDQYKRFL